jgi:segregation and condensation protein A
MEDFSVVLDIYNGPIELLLSLISKHEIDILDIPISTLADQYMAELNRFKELNLDIAAEFIEMGSYLMLIKSKMLLPRDEKEPDPRAELVDNLLAHQNAKIASEMLSKRLELYFNRFPKDPEPTDGVYTGKLAISLLRDAFERMKLRESVEQFKKEDEVFFNKLKKEQYHTVESKTLILCQRLNLEKSVRFYEFFEDSESNNEIIAIFLALLDIIRLGMAYIIKNGDEVTIHVADTET